MCLCLCYLLAVHVQKQSIKESINQSKLSAKYNSTTKSDGFKQLNTYRKSCKHHNVQNIMQ